MDSTRAKTIVIPIKPNSLWCWTFKETTLKNGEKWVTKRRRLLLVCIGTKEIYCKIQVDTNVDWFKEEREKLGKLCKVDRAI
jgi:hypothetical protein